MVKVITLEGKDGPYQILLHSVMQIVPDRDKNDIDLQRLIAFRLRTDGESATREYLMRKIRDMIQCAYKGRLFDFVKDSKNSSICGFNDSSSRPPDIA
ncbi:MAG: hypothetical protein GY874_09555 [Desulfobacteraceae bacterium]|nr:hypothetical protein [Desulfobacteraceae bacterium]